MTAKEIIVSQFKKWPQVIKSIITLAILLLVYQIYIKPVREIRSEVKVVNKNIETKEREIHVYELVKEADLNVVKGLQAEKENLLHLLSQAKVERDTVTIIQIQDTMIGNLTYQNEKLTGVIDIQDSMISVHRYIINSKDTVIALQKEGIKRIKRQRNISIIGNIILGGAALLK